MRLLEFMNVRISECSITRTSEYVPLFEPTALTFLMLNFQIRDCDCSYFFQRHVNR